MTQINITQIVTNSIIANLAINPQIKQMLHNDMSLDDFVDTMKLWISTDSFWQHLAVGLLQFMQIGTWCNRCNKLHMHDPVDSDKAPKWQTWQCEPKQKQGKPRRVNSLRGSK